MGNHFGIGLRCKYITIGDQAFTQRMVVLDNPVVHHAYRNSLRLRQMWVGVVLCDTAVGGPSGVCNAAVRTGLYLIDAPFELTHPADGSQSLQT